MKLIVGLGNPGKKFEGTRHNIGFMVLDALAREFSFSFQSDKAKFKGDLAEIRHPVHQKVFFLKPNTFMNLSGESVIAVSQFYKIPPQDILVIYDDLDLALGRTRLAKKGSAGGHNGMKSLIEHVGTQDFPRLKLGIGRPKVVQQPVIDYVLQKFASEEKESVAAVLDKAVSAVQFFLEADDLEKVMNRFNQ